MKKFYVEKKNKYKLYICKVLSSVYDSDAVAIILSSVFKFSVVFQFTTNEWIHSYMYEYSDSHFKKTHIIKGDEWNALKKLKPFFFSNELDHDFVEKFRKLALYLFEYFSSETFFLDKVRSNNMLSELYLVFRSSLVLQTVLTSQLHFELE